MTIADFTGHAIDPAHADFDAARRGWNHMIERKPALILRCTCVEDVVAAVRHAAAHGLTALARCGGHSVSGASLPEGGLMVDLGGLKQIEVFADRKLARVGGGCLLGELDAATQAHGLAVTAGVEPETGVGGLTLGGGIGFIARKFGLTIDSLTGAQVVLADGRVVEASEEEHADLFWALRGGGGQFGIVTRFDFALHEVGPDVMVAQAFYPLDKAPQVMRFYREYMHGMPDDLGVVPAFMKVPPVDPFPAEWHGKPCIALIGCHLGDEVQAREQMQPFLEQGGMIFGFIASQPYLDFQRTFGGASPEGGRYYWKSIFVDELNDELVQVMMDGIASIPGEYTQLFMEAMGGAVARVGVQDTAFSNRSARYNLGISAGWADPAMDAKIIAATRECFDRLAPFSDGTVYLNYLDRDELSRAEAGFGPNYARLCQVKAKYDPDNRFGGPLGGAGTSPA